MMANLLNGQARRIASQLEQQQSREQDDSTLLELSQYRESPIEFIEKGLGERLTEDQKEIARRVANNRITLVPACHGVGKSFLAARLTLWAVLARRQLAVSTAPTRRQVDEILWSEIRKVCARSQIPGELGRSFFRVDEFSQAFGFSASTSGSAADSAFQGLHSERGILVILDEANGLDPRIVDGAFACLSGGEDRLLAIGNPTVGGTPFQDLCERFGAIRLPAWGHPNVWGKYQLDSDGIHRLKPEWRSELPTDYPIPGAITCQWIEEIRESKDENSPFWQGRVEARFPESSAASLIPMAWLESALARHPQGADKSRTWGVDVGDGIDAHAVACFSGDTLTFCSEIPSRGDGRDTDRLCDFIKRLVNKDELIAVDATGVGAGVVSNLLSSGYRPLRIHFGAKAEDSQQFANWVTEAGWRLRERLRLEQVSFDADFALAREQKALFWELSKTEYQELKTSKVALEPKDATKSRLNNKSPNLRDAVLLAWGARYAKPHAFKSLRQTGQVTFRETAKRLDKF